MDLIVCIVLMFAALLVEQAFVTNAEDVAALCEGDGIHAAARAYYRAICAYFGVSAAA